jgi:hypothetical protein
VEARKTAAIARTGATYVEVFFLKAIAKKYALHKACYNAVRLINKSMPQLVPIKQASKIIVGGRL